MKIKLLVAAVAATSLAGCASQDYKMYAETQAKIAMAQAMAEKARYEAMQDIGDASDVARVAAVMAMQSDRIVAQSRAPALKEPEHWSDKLYKWTVGLMPGVVQLYGIDRQASVAQHASDNARDIAINRDTTMVDLVHGETIVTQPVILTDEDGNETVANPVVDRP